MWELILGGNRSLFRWRNVKGGEVGKISVDLDYCAVDSWAGGLGLTRPEDDGCCETSRGSMLWPLRILNSRT